MIWDTVISSIVGEVGKHFPSEIEKAQAEAAIRKIVTDAAAQAEAEITKRWEADSKSDSWLAKNTRPLMLWQLFYLYVGEAVTAGFGHPIPETYVTLTAQALIAAMGAYFVMRGSEKIASSKYAN